MKLKSLFIAMVMALVPVTLFWGCKGGNQPVSPANFSSLSIVVPSVNSILSTTASTLILYNISGSGAPVTGSYGPFPSPGGASTVSFNVTLPGAASSYSLISLQGNDGSSGQLLALGAAPFPTSSSSVSIELGRFKTCYTVSNFATNDTYSFQNNTFSTSSTNMDIECDLNSTGTAYQLADPALSINCIAYMGNGNLVNFDAVPPVANFKTQSTASKSAVLGTALLSTLALNDVYCVKLKSGGYAWLQITNAGSALTSTGPSFVFRLNTTVSYFAYQQSTADLSGACGMGTTIPTSTPTATPIVYGSTIYNLDGADPYDVAVLGPANGPATSIYVPDPGGDGSGDVVMIDVPTTNTYSLDDAADVSLNMPIGLAFDSTGVTLFVMDPNLGPSCQIFTIGAGYTNYSRTAQMTSIYFNEPRYVTANSSGDIFVTSAGDTTDVGGILEFGPPPISAVSTVLTAWNGLFASPAPASTGIGQVASYGTTLIVADAENNQIELYSGSSTFPFAGTNTAYSVLTSDNNPAGAVAFNNPQGVAVDSTGMLYISDTSNNRIVLMSVSGTFNEILGPLVSSSLPDPNLSGNTGIKVDNASPPNIYVADTVNDRIVEFQPCSSCTPTPTPTANVYAP